MQNIGRAFSFMFEDKQWLSKIFLGAVFNVLSLILIGIPFILGYLLELAKNTSEGKEIPLPEWTNLGDKFMQGLVYLVILIIYSLPGLVLSLIPCVRSCLAPLYFLALVFVVPYITVRFAITNNFNEAFQFNQIFEFMKANIGNLIIVVLLSIALQIIASFGTLVFVVGVFFSAFWADLAVFYLYGQLYLSAVKEEKPQAPAAPATQ